jgi:hypothetical protein
MLDAVISHGADVFVTKGLLPQPGDVSGHYDIGIKIYSLFILREKNRDKEAEINTQGTEGLEPVTAETVKTL